MSTPIPTDLFSELAETFDDARQVLVDVGLRLYRVFLYLRVFEGPGRDGAVVGEIVEEIRPSPRVEFLSLAKIAAAQGLLTMGSARLSKITRTLSEEQLRGKTVFGDDLPPNMHFSIALIAKGQRAATLYTPASEPILGSTEWSMLIRPLNLRSAEIPIPPDTPSSP